jgi:hypothetical protein
MLNLKERHIVVLLVLIAVTFLLFLSTRKPICLKEGMSLNNEFIYKIKSKNTDDLKFDDYQNSEYSSIENKDLCVGKINLKKNEPIVLSKNQIKEYDMNNAEVLEDKIDLKKISSNNKVTKVKSKKISNKKFVDSYSINNNVNPNSNIVIYNKYENDIEPSNYGTKYSNINILDNNFTNVNETVNETVDETVDETVNETVDETVNETVDETVDETVNETVDETVNETVDETVDETKEQDVISKTFNEVEENDDYHEKCVPMGNIDNKLNAYGLLRKEILSYDKINYKKDKNLDESKCSTLRNAVLDLNKTGYIDNNSVEKSWNGTFKETCGNW